MKTRPVVAANADGDAATPPLAALASQAGLDGNDLPRRWAGRARFVVLETGFGLGCNFLATWQAWRDDPQRCERLFFVAIEPHPPRGEDLRRALAGSPAPDLAQALLQAWPPLTPNLHALDFDDGRVQLLLAFGSPGQLLPALRLQADAFYLDGPAAASDTGSGQPRLLKALARKAAADASLASPATGAALHAGLLTAGFRVDPRTQADEDAKDSALASTRAQFKPAFTAARPPADGACPQARSAVVIGAGVAGAAVAQALTQLGLQVTVLERHAAPASEASGNPAGLFHGTLNPDDGPYARLFRAAALHARRDYAGKLQLDPLAGSVGGLLRASPEAGGLAAMQRLLAELGLPADYVQALDAAAASALAGVPLSAPAWYYPGGGWIDPARWVQLALDHPRITLRGQADATALRRAGSDWQVLDAAGQVLAQAPVLVVAATASTSGLLAHRLDGSADASAGGDAGAPWSLRATQGQVTHWSATQEAPALLRPVAGDGYAIPLPGSGLLCGATREDVAVEAMRHGMPVTAAAHAANLQRLARLTGLQPPREASALQGRSGYRLHTDDRLPIAGALPLRAMPADQRRDQPRLLPREKGLLVLTALGARGLTLAPLLGRLVAAQATGTPWPLEQDLADAVDPARWLVRAARSAGAAGSADVEGSANGRPEARRTPRG